jgi:hypothetical protein
VARRSALTLTQGRALEDHDDLLHKLTMMLEKQEKVMEVLTQKIMLLESHDNDNGERLNNHSYRLGRLELPQQVRELRLNPFVLDLISSFRLLVFCLPWSMGLRCPLLDGHLLLHLLGGLLCLLLQCHQASTLALVVSAQVAVIIKEVPIMVIVTVVCVVMLVGCTVGLPVL